MNNALSVFNICEWVELLSIGFLCFAALVNAVVIWLVGSIEKESRKR